MLEATRKRDAAETSLRVSELNYPALFNAMDDGFCIIEKLTAPGEPSDYCYIHANLAFERQAGLTMCGTLPQRQRRVRP